MFFQAKMLPLSQDIEHRTAKEDLVILTIKARCNKNVLILLPHLIIH